MNDEFASSTVELLSLQLMHRDIIQQSVDVCNVYNVDDVHNTPLPTTAVYAHRLLVDLQKIRTNTGSFVRRTNWRRVH